MRQSILFLVTFCSLGLFAMERECRFGSLGAGIASVVLNCGDHKLKLEGVLLGGMIQLGHVTLSCDHELIQGAYHAFFGAIGLPLLPAPTSLWLVKKDEDGECTISGFPMGLIPIGIGYGFATIR